MADGIGIGGLSISTIVLAAGLYFAFVKKGKNKTMGYMLLAVWAFILGGLSGLIPMAGGGVDAV